MTRKLDLYKKYHQKYGVSLTKTERTRLLQPTYVDNEGSREESENEEMDDDDLQNKYSMEYVLAYKMLDRRELNAAIRIQKWWRSCKAFKIIRLLS